eukprot:scaffold44519_cov214-Amphora_coffeaeformis.AAC.3
MHITTLAISFVGEAFAVQIILDYGAGYAFISCCCLPELQANAIFDPSPDNAKAKLPSPSMIT